MNDRELTAALEQAEGLALVIEGLGQAGAQHPVIPDAIEDVRHLAANLHDAIGEADTGRRRELVLLSLAPALQALDGLRVGLPGDVASLVEDARSRGMLDKDGPAA